MLVKPTGDRRGQQALNAAIGPRAVNQTLARRRQPEARASVVESLLKSQVRRPELAQARDGSPDRGLRAAKDARNLAHEARAKDVQRKQALPVGTCEPWELDAGETAPSERGLLDGNADHVKDSVQKVMYSVRNHETHPDSAA